MSKIWKYTLGILFLISFLVFIPPLLINIAMDTKAPFKIVGDELNWLQFWGSYMAAMGTFFVIVITLIQQKQLKDRQEEQERKLEEKERQNKTEQLELIRKQEERQNKLLEREYKYRIYEKFEKYLYEMFDIFEHNKVEKIVTDYENESTLNDKYIFMSSFSQQRMRINSICKQIDESEECDNYFKSLNSIISKTIELLFKFEEVKIINYRIKEGEPINDIANSRIKINKNSENSEGSHKNIIDFIEKIRDNVEENITECNEATEIIHILLEEEYLDSDFCKLEYDLHINTISFLQHEQQKLSQLNNL